MHTEKLFLVFLIGIAIVLGVMAYLFIFQDDESIPSDEFTDLLDETKSVKPDQGNESGTDQGQPKIDSGPSEDPVAAKTNTEQVAPREYDMYRHGQVLGKVVDGRKRPVIQAQVILFREYYTQARVDALERTPEREVFRALTDANGRYLFSNIPAPGRYELVAFTEGKAALNRPTVPVYPKKAHEAPNLILGAGWRLHGTVTDPDGAPVPGALVFFELESLDEKITSWLFEQKESAESETPESYEAQIFKDHISLRQKSKTDETGRFDFGLVGSGKYRVGAWSQGYAMVINRQVATSPETHKTGLEVNLVLESAQMIRGVVRDKDRNPVCGAEIRAERDGKRTKVSIAHSVSRDEDGLFRLKDLVQGRYIISARKEGYLPAFATDITSGTTNVVLVMGKTSSIFGNVVDTEGKPVKDFSVTLCSQALRRGAGPKPLRPWESFQNADGSFELQGAKRGRYLLAARVDGYGSGFSDPISLKDGEDGGPFVVRIERGFNLKGRVKDAHGQAIEGARVMLLQGGRKPSDLMKIFGEQAAKPHKESPSLHPCTSTDASGNFLLTGVMQGSYTLKISHPDYEELFVPDVAVEARENNSAGDIVLSRGGMLLVEVTDSEGAPMTQTYCKVTGIDVKEFYHARTDDGGRARFINITPGTYEVTLNVAFIPILDGTAKPPRADKITVNVVEGKETLAELHAR
ncbi:MAG: carboxypeptidase regulatory-like domain-containing protein [Planctomycetota bacterium]|jgi:protocatechuate 3,4-dioxygenase beta subunit